MRQYSKHQAGKRQAKSVLDISGSLSVYIVRMRKDLKIYAGNAVKMFKFSGHFCACVELDFNGY